jgi:hypothetical protein
MKIYGGHDYYDSASVYGIDTSTIFVRKELEFDKHPFYYRVSRDYGMNYLTNFDIVVAGKLYPSIIYGEYGKKDKFIYNKEELENTSIYDKLSKYTKDEYNNYFNDSIKSNQLEWLIDNKIVLGYTLGNRFIANNSNLRNLEFFKVLSPTQAHQEIYSWISGVLTSSKPTIQLNNNQKIVKAGFDTITSFRHPV